MGKNILWTFRYNGTHLQDEQYMQHMCRQGWAALSLVEGFWRFEPCEAGAYCYRVCYLRGKSREEVQALKEACGRRGIEFVSRYSFWAIFRSTAPFRLYTPEEEAAVCRRIYAPMSVGMAVGWPVVLLLLALALGVSRWFLLPALLAAVYTGVATYCGLSYRRLIQTLH